MKDTFHMGYDLAQAGFDFTYVHQTENTAIITGIAEDFVKASLHKAGVAGNKEEILYRFDEAIPALTVAEPILILAISSSAAISVRFINRSNPLFHNLFIEELTKA
jgi:hypothetical protein